MDDNRTNGRKSKDRKKSSQSSTELDSSPFSTGIYKKKGHLNERAFSYSIRQEHRSRSNSLTNLHFDAQNGESSVLSTNSQSQSYHPNDNSYQNHNKTNPRNGSLTERELSERLTAFKINGNGGPPPAPPPPPPINGLLDEPKVATIKRRLNSKY